MSLESLKSSCTYYNGRRLWFGRIALMSRVLDVRGWRGGRLFREQVRLEDVSSVARGNDSTTGNLILGLHDGGEKTLTVTAPGIWRMQIDYRLRRIASANGAKPDASTEDASDLPTADELEHISVVSSVEAPESLDDAFFKDVGSWPVFEEDQTPGIGVVAIERDAEEAEFRIDPILPADDAPEEMAFSSGDGEQEPPDRALIDALHVDAPDAEAEGDLLVEATQGLHEIGDDQVSEQVMDASSHETVVLDWLQPAEEPPHGVRFSPISKKSLPIDGDEASTIEAGGEPPVGKLVEADVETPRELSEPVAETESDRDIGPETDWVGDLTVFKGVPTVAESGIEIALDSDIGDEPEVELKADVDLRVVEAEVELVPEADVAPKDPPAETIPIVSRPFQHSKVYQARPAPEGEPEEEPEALATEPLTEPELVAASEPERVAEDQSPQPSAPDAISIEPSIRRDRLPIESLVHLRPASLADLIRGAEPTWTPLAEID
jgi:hypothetical protein